MIDNDPVDGRTCGWILAIYSVLTAIGVVVVVILSMAIVGAIAGKIKAEDFDRWLCDVSSGADVYGEVEIIPYEGEGWDVPYGLETVPILLPANTDRHEGYYLAFSVNRQTLYIWPLPDFGNEHSSCDVIAVKFDGVP